MNVFPKLFTYYGRAYSIYEHGEAIRGKADRMRCHFGGWFYQQSITGFPIDGENQLCFGTVAGRTHYQPMK
jgi:hypothetical protein